jgi:HD-GYP domain-containing protein (c-di-GMP phosphodiesterase class II)
VDAYDAMTSRRPYRAASTREWACNEISSNAGTQFDPVLVDAFLRVIRRTAEEELSEWHDATSRIETHAGVHN